MRFLKILLFVAAICFLFFFLQNKLPLWSSDEGRYGEIAREMWESKDFVMSQFNYVDYLEKPVLAPFFSSIAFGLFGENSFSIRLVPILSALLGILTAFLFTRRLFSGQTAFITVLILTTMLGYVLVGRFAVIDMLMTFFMSASLLCMLAAHIRQKAWYYLAAYAAMGFAFLTKGLIAMVLPGLIFFVFLIWSKNFGEIKKIHLFLGLLIIGVIVLPWWFMITAREPDFFDTFIVKQHFTRFATGSFGRKRPFWFFIPVLIVTSFPWSFFIPAAIIRGLKQEGEARRKIQFLICWIAVIFIFFSIPKSKLPYYLLPTSMAIAILVADFLSAWAEQGERLPGLNPKLMRWTWNLLAGIFLLAGAGLPVFLAVYSDEEVNALKLVLFAGAAVLLIAGLAVRTFLKKEKRKEAVFSLAGMVYALLIFAFIGMVKLTPFQSTYDFAAVLHPILQPGDKVAIYGSPDRFSDFPFHLKRRIAVTGPNRGTLLEESLKPENAEALRDWFIWGQDFANLFNQRSQRIFCLLKNKDLAGFQSEGLKDYYVVKEGQGKILISNQPLI